MRIDVITKYEDFLALKETWNSLYEKDPDAQFFLSWTFLSTYIRRYEGGWFILAASLGPEGSPYVALLPLRIRTRMSKKTGQFHNEINMAGNYAADYTGIICAPEFDDRAIPALAKHLRKMHWAKLHLENLRMSERRLRFFLKNLADERLDIRKMTRVNKVDNVDNCKCPSLHLPGSWDAYLEQQLGSNTRQKFRRFLRKVESSDEFRITHADASTIDRDVGILLDFWRVKWTPRKGNLVPGLLKSNRLLFKNAFGNGTLFLPILWHGEKPLCAMAFFVDPAKRAMLFHMTGRDETADVIPSGMVLHAYCIRRAIEQGFRIYDFLRGDEPYKYTFGAKDTVINCVLVQTKTGRNLDERLDTRSVGSVFRQATELHKANELTKAEAAYRQILKVNPTHELTMYVLGQLQSTKGDHWEAAKTYEALSAVVPTSAKVWFRLAGAYQALDRHSEAANAFRKALELKPGFAQAQNGLGRSLIELQRTEKATHALSALHRRSDNLARPVAPTNAKTRLQELNLDERRYFILPDQVKSILPVRERSAS